MKVKLELLNLITGFTLLLVGAVDLYGRQYIQAASWIIFGSMYLVMDNYREDSITMIRATFGWVGMLGSALLLVYRLWI